MQPSQLTILEFGNDARSVWADVAILGPQLTVSADVAEKLLAQRPSLAEHTCKSAASTRDSATSTREGPQLFKDHLPGALLPHALEHLAIDLLVSALPGETFAGNTHWLEREDCTMQDTMQDTMQGAMRVHISLPKGGNATLVYKALSEALLLLNELLQESQRQIG